MNSKPLNSYESDRSLGEYLLFHYGTVREIAGFPAVPKEAMGFPVRCAEYCNRYLPPGERGRVLDLGCAVGRSSFELARTFSAVNGMDLSRNFIRVAQALKEHGNLDYMRVDEGGLATKLTALIDPLIERTRIEFLQGDACNLPENMEGFDAVLMANLLCRLPDPAKCLVRAQKLVREGGVLIIATPCTWSEDYTLPSKWLGGYIRDGIRVTTFDGIRALLEADFKLEEVADESFLIREHARKYQLGCSQLTVWRKT